MKSTALHLMLVGGTMILAGESAFAQFIPKKPSDVIPRKPEDILPKFPQNETQFSGNSKITFTYTLWNNSNETVRIKLPSGKDYILKQGEKGSYKFTGYKPEAKIHVYNTGKTYHLEGGDHKFWWIRSESRVGFDLNYKK